MTKVVGAMVERRAVTTHQSGVTLIRLFILFPRLPVNFTFILRIQGNRLLQYLLSPSAHDSG